jgi:signal transduction histidine kinase
VRLDALALEAAAAVPGVEVAAPGPVVVRGERAALERALANLVENAYRHGRGPIVVSVAEHDGLARVTVRDEGPGLQPYEARHAFERFWRGNRDAAGSGLGLAIVRATAERHGGRAYVEGAAFSVEVPAVRDFSESAGTTGAPPEKGFR